MCFVLFFLVFLGFDLKSLIYLIYYQSDFYDFKLERLIGFVGDRELYLNTILYVFIFKCAFLVCLFIFNNAKFSEVFNYKELHVFKIEGSVFLVWVVFVILLSIFTFFAQVYLEIGFLGKDLPFKISAIIIYTRLLIIPLFFLAFIFLLSYQRSNNLILLNSLIFLFFTHTFMSAFLMTSKGYVVFFSFSVSMVLFLNKFSTYRIFKMTSLYWLVAFFLYGFFEFYRGIYVQNGYDHFLAIQYISLDYNQSADSGGFDFVENSSIVFLYLVIRVVGFDAVMQINDFISSFGYLGFFDVLLDGRNFSKMYTTDILGYSPDAPHSASPSLLGSILMLSNNLYLFFILSFGYIFSCGLIFFKLSKSASPLKIPVSILFILIFSLCFTSGNIGMMIFCLVMLIIMPYVTFFINFMGVRSE